MTDNSIFIITDNSRVATRTMRMTLEGDTSTLTMPGQFVEIAVPGCFLRRPISVCDYSEGSLTLLYDVVGDGTAEMARMEAGQKLDVISGLGRGFDINAGGRSPLLIGGGIGVAPFLRLAKDLMRLGKQPVALFGFNTAADISLAEDMRRLGVETKIATADGSEGTRGFVTELLRQTDGDYFYACGPVPMLKAVCETAACDGELSMDVRMGCGFGVCMCCTVETAGGAKRVCKEGPVFKKNELIWK